MYEKMKAALAELEKRIRKPENADNYYEMISNSDSETSQILFHYNRAADSLKALENNTATYRELAESDFSVSIKKLKELLDKGGWA